MAGGLVHRDGAITGRLDTRVFRLVAIKKAAYRLADRFSISFEEVADDFVDVRLQGNSDWTAADAAELVRMFTRELLDQELREQVADETGPLRALILAHAFSKTGLIRDE